MFGFNVEVTPALLLSLWWFVPILWLWQIVRHEGAHAWAATHAGFNVVKFVIWPTIRDGEFRWGYTQWMPIRGGPLVTPSYVYHMPYYVDLLLVAVGLPSLYLVTWPSFTWFALAACITVVSAVLDITYNLLKWVVFETGDFQKALKTRK